MKFCAKCGETKPLDAFYRHPFGKDGRQEKCIECAKAASRENRAARLDYYRAYDRQRARDPHRVDARVEYNRTHPRVHPETDPVKRAARIAVGNAIRDGKLIRPTSCEVCGVECEPHGHHDDYNKPIDVIWCCPPCHALIHAYWRAQVKSAA